MAVAFEDWMLALAALIFGVGIGWLFWGGRPARESRTEPKEGTPESPGATAGDGPAPHSASGAGAPASPTPVVDGQQLGGIERELKDARELLNEGEEELRLFNDEIAELDGVLKRINARLRLLIREIRRRSPGGGAAEGDSDA